MALCPPSLRHGVGYRAYSHAYLQFTELSVRCRYLAFVRCLLLMMAIFFSACFKLIFDTPQHNVTIGQRWKKGMQVCQ
jgi:hypothetical protein